jgi:hypothetical protein
MADRKSVLLIGWDPAFADLSQFPDMTPAKVMAGLNAAKEKAHGLGYDMDLCLVETSETAEAAVVTWLARKPYDCVVFGAAVRVVPAYLLLFEKLINVVHEHAPRARICFNTSPANTIDAIQRWI